MGNTRAQEIFRQIIRLARDTSVALDLRLDKIEMAAEAALDEIRREQRRTADQALFERDVRSPIVEDTSGMALA